MAMKYFKKMMLMNKKSILLKMNLGDLVSEKCSASIPYRLLKTDYLFQKSNMWNQNLIIGWKSKIKKQKHVLKDKSYNCLINTHLQTICLTQKTLGYEYAFIGDIRVNLW